MGIVFHRPLPYLYLSQQVLADARIPYQTFDALPLAAEPYAALLDLVVTVARTGGTTDASIDLVQSRLLEVTVDGVPLEPRDAAQLEEVLIERRVTGDAMGYLVAVEAAARVGALRGAGLEGARRAALALQGFAAELSSYRTAPTASAQIRTIETFLRQH